MGETVIKAHYINLFLPISKVKKINKIALEVKNKH